MYDPNHFHHHGQFDSLDQPGQRDFYSDTLHEADMRQMHHRQMMHQTLLTAATIEAQEANFSRFAGWLNRTLDKLFRGK